MKDVLLLERHIPLSLGLETLGGRLHQVDRAQYHDPRSRKSQVFSTASTIRTAVTIRVLQGERQMADDNVELGRFDLVGIPPAPRGIPQVRSRSNNDATVSCTFPPRIRGTGKEQTIRITAPKKLSKEEIRQDGQGRR
jgi:molecular chaperone DnaK